MADHFTYSSTSHCFDIPKWWYVEWTMWGWPRTSVHMHMRIRLRQRMRLLVSYISQMMVYSTRILSTWGQTKYQLSTSSNLWSEMTPNSLDEDGEIIKYQGSLRLVVGFPAVKSIKIISMCNHVSISYWDEFGWISNVCALLLCAPNLSPKLNLQPKVHDFHIKCRGAWGINTLLYNVLLNNTLLNKVWRGAWGINTLLNNLLLCCDYLNWICYLLLYWTQ